VPQGPRQKEFTDPAVPSALKQVLADATEVTDEMKNLQRKKPTLCAMTLEQWNRFINSCKDEPLWQEIKDEKGFVSIYDVNEAFVKPWTRGTGCGVALLMNKATLGKEAEVMLSHSWAEDAEECQNALNLAAKDGHIEDTSAVWFCTFAQYQVEDDAGPSISEQLEGKPFEKVITSAHVKKMLAIHTSKSDLYERLWCVHEVDKAIDEKKEPVAAFSAEYAKDIENKYNAVIEFGGEDADAMDRAGITVRSGQAECSRPEDTQMLLKEVLSKKGGFRRIDEVVSNFRRQQVSEFISKSLRESPKAIIAHARKYPVQAVEMLYHIAAKGGQEQQDDLLARKLKPWATDKGQLGFQWNGLLDQTSDGFDKACVDRLVFTLLLTMVKSGHAQAMQIAMACSSGTSNGQWATHGSHFHRDRAWDHFRHQEAFDALQILAKEGYQQAIDDLASRLTKKGSEEESAKLAFENLALGWNLMALKALEDVGGKQPTLKDWAEETLEKYVRRPLRCQW
jgi:hypothetical protein